MEHLILTSFQREIIDYVAKEPHLENFYLSGGTALAAFYFQHRLSDDLDFFTFTPPDTVFLHSFINKIKEEAKLNDVNFEKLYDRNIFFFLRDSEQLKIEFSLYPFKQLENPIKKEGIWIDSLKDIAANKLMAMLDRFDPKDFVDLFFLFKEFDLEHVRKNTEKKFGLKIDPIFLGGEFMKSRRIEALPKMARHLELVELKDFFQDIAKKLSSQIF